MKAKKKAFTLLEVLFAIMIFAVAMPVIVNCFLSGIAMPKAGGEAALMADIDNCITNVSNIKDSDAAHLPAGISTVGTRANPQPTHGYISTVHSMFDKNNTFKVSKTSWHITAALDYSIVTISDYPGLRKKIYIVSYEVVN
ncbi:MAG: type II secretion system GspH family protein [Puniceicoccales bacterium]|jgi:prepilin-type N-terminal cleavage/methylation domain-containing protein|nr:type II secretion system GspH family protein [Puniceicoccales bacterium]